MTRLSYKRWTVGEDVYLQRRIRELDLHCAWRAIIAAELGRSLDSLNYRLQHFGLPTLAQPTCSLRQLAAWTGIPGHQFLKMFKAGRFQDLAGCAGPPCHEYLIPEWRAVSFLSNMESWRHWSPTDLTRPDWRARFTKLRASWVDSSGAGKILDLDKDSVSQLRRSGKLEGRVRYMTTFRNFTWYDRADLLRLRARYLHPELGRYVWEDHG